MVYLCSFSSILVYVIHLQIVQREIGSMPSTTTATANATMTRTATLRMNFADVTDDVV